MPSPDGAVQSSVTRSNEGVRVSPVAPGVEFAGGALRGPRVGSEPVLPALAPASGDGDGVVVLADAEGAPSPAALSATTA